MECITHVVVYVPSQSLPASSWANAEPQTIARTTRSKYTALFIYERKRVWQPGKSRLEIMSCHPIKSEENKEGEMEIPCVFSVFVCWIDENHNAHVINGVSEPRNHLENVQVILWWRMSFQGHPQISRWIRRKSSHLKFRLLPSPHPSREIQCFASATLVLWDFSRKTFPVGKNIYFPVSQTARLMRKFYESLSYELLIPKVSTNQTKMNTLPEQRLEDLDVTKLDAYDPIVMCRQVNNQNNPYLISLCLWIYSRKIRFYSSRDKDSAFSFPKCCVVWTAISAVRIIHQHFSTDLGCDLRMELHPRGVFRMRTGIQTQCCRLLC